MIMKCAVVAKHTSGNRWISEYIKSGAEDYFSVWIMKQPTYEYPQWLCYAHMDISHIYATVQYTKTKD